MEKFGIFSLLSALAGQNDENTRSEPQTAQASEEKPRANTAEKPAHTAPDPRLARAESFLEKHDAISRRIDKNNRR